MLTHMMVRTTLVLHESCMDRVRALASKQRRTISEIVNELLLEGLARRRPGSARSTFTLATYPMGATAAPLHDRDALESIMETHVRGH